jgi:hypothetical protein
MKLSGERAAHIQTCSLHHSHIGLAWESIPMTHDFKVGDHVECSVRLPARPVPASQTAQ